MKGLRIEIETPVQDKGKTLYWRRTNYFFDGRSSVTKTNVIGEHWFFDNEEGFQEGFNILENFWEYCVRHNRTQAFDDEVKIRYEYIPLKDTIYCDSRQFVKTPCGAKGGNGGKRD